MGPPVALMGFALRNQGRQIVLDRGLALFVRSSATVLFVLDEILRRDRPEPGALGLLGAFGPGFGAELAILEFR